MQHQKTWSDYQMLEIEEGNQEMSDRGFKAFSLLWLGIIAYLGFNLLINLYI